MRLSWQREWSKAADMRTLLRLIPVCCVLSVGGLGSVPAATSQWARLDESGRLEYGTTERGDRIMDFSHAGYGGGGVALPDVAVVETVRPSGGEDDAVVIQAALDRAASRPLQDGFRGAVLLAPGSYLCPRPITIEADGVVLRGSGSGAPGDEVSSLQLTGEPHTAIIIRRATGGRGQPPADEAGVATRIADAYVPSGAQSFTVADAAGFTVGDAVLIRRRVTAEWIRFMEMHDLVREGRPQTWLRAGTHTTTERTIAAINGRTLTLDVPLADAFDARHTGPGGVEVRKASPPARVVRAGIERLHIAAPRQEISHSQPHFTALRLDGEDCWVRDVVCDETMNSVGVSGRRHTLERVVVRRKARHQGASKPAEFAPNGSQVLLDRCAVEGDNVWFVATGAGVAGPLVILNGEFSGASRAESHQRWSTGILFDNCRAPAGGIELRNRGSMGSGHGWSMGWGVIWNCVAKDYLVQNPPGARNWLIGSTGLRQAAPRPFGVGPDLPGGTDDSPGVPVAPKSLYLAQLAERLGPEALRAIGYGSTDPASTVRPQPLMPPEATPVAAESRARSPNLATDRPVLATNMRGGDRKFAPWLALDDDDGTFWSTDDDAREPQLEFDTEGALLIDAVELGEAAGMAGRVQSWRVEGFTGGSWQLLAEGEGIGARLQREFPPAKVWKVRLTILRSIRAPAICHLGIYRAGGNESPVRPRAP